MYSIRSKPMTGSNNCAKNDPKINSGNKNSIGDLLNIIVWINKKFLALFHF